MQDIYDRFVELLNDNTDGLKYEGNFIFQFHTDSMDIYQTVTGTLVKELLEYSPVGVTSRLPIPFVENNKRIDWALEFGILVRIHGQKYEAETDLDYANIKRVTTLLQGTVYEATSKRYTFKTQDPNIVGMIVMGAYKYALVTVAMNVTEIAFGRFGQEFTWTLDGTSIDVTNATITSTRGYRTTNNKSDQANDYNVTINRSVVIELTFNFNDEANVVSEIMGKSDLSLQHTLRCTYNSVNYDYVVTAESAPTNLQRGSVVRPTIRFVEV